MGAANVLALLPGLISEKINIIQAHEFTGRKKITRDSTARYRLDAQGGRFSEGYFFFQCCGLNPGPHKRKQVLLHATEVHLIYGNSGPDEVI